MDRLMYFFSNLIWYYAAFSLLGHLLCNTNEKKYPGRVFWYTGGFFFCVGVMAGLCEIPYRFQGCANICLCYLYSFLFFKNYKFRNCLAGVCFGAGTTLIHYVFEWGVRNWILQYDTVWNGKPKYTYPIFATCAVVVLFILYRIVIMVYFLVNGRKLNLFGMINFSVTIIYSALFIYFILVVRNHVYLFVDNQVLILVLLLGLVMINAYALAYGTSLMQNSILRYMLKKAEEKNQLTYEYYKNMENQIHECRSILHDVKNHVQVLEGMYQSGDFDAANGYAGTLAGEIEAIYPRCYSSNKMVDIILQDKEKKALQSNTRMHYEVEDVDWGFMSDYHLSTILCNLFDNAITGCTKLPEDMREITCKIRKVNGFLVLKMSNPLDPVHVKEMEKKTLQYRLKTGTGLCNVRKVVGLYKGEFSTTIDDNLFAVSVSFSI